MKTFSFNSFNIFVKHKGGFWGGDTLFYFENITHLRNKLHYCIQTDVTVDALVKKKKLV